MPGKQFDPHNCLGHFVGLALISGTSWGRNVTDYPRRVSAQFQATGMGAGWIAVAGRTLKGHVALMCGQDKKITTMIGWDPKRRVSVGFRSTLPLLGGNTKLPPVQGQWRLACGLDKDPTVVYFGCQVSHQQKKRFETFLRSLSGRPDLGEHLSNGVLHFLYSFTPDTHTTKYLSNASSYLSKQGANDAYLTIVSNCGDAAFHVLATFLYEWGFLDHVNELRTFLRDYDRLHDVRVRNFSCGLLMHWAAEPNVFERVEI